MPELQISKVVRIMNANDGEKQTIIDSLEKRYSETDFDQRLVSATVLKALLFDGLVDPDLIRKELDASPAFAAPGSEPAWKRVSNAWRIADVEFERAYLEMEAQFERHEFDIPGQIFQIFGLRLYLSDIGILRKSKKTIVAECKKYINQLARTNRIKDKYTDTADMEVFVGWGGYAYYSAETADFRELLEHYRQTVDEVAKAKLPKVGNMLLELMATDETKYLRILCRNEFEKNPYYNAPVLATIKPHHFVKAVLQLHPFAQSTVLSVFKLRYEHGLLKGELNSEEEWLEKVKQVFSRQTKGPMARYRIRTLIQHYVDPHLP